MIWEGKHRVKLSHPNSLKRKHLQNDRILSPCRPVESFSGLHLYKLCKSHLSTAVQEQKFLQMNIRWIQHNSIGGFLCVVKYKVHFCNICNILQCLNPPIVTIAGFLGHYFGMTKMIHWIQRAHVSPKCHTFIASVICHSFAAMHIFTNMPCKELMYPNSKKASLKMTLLLPKVGTCGIS